jgi:hypothetical protein
MNSRNQATGKGWTPEEERAIAETVAMDGISRLDAIRRLRSSWLIGETAPPGSRPRRAMPKANPNKVSAAAQDGLISGAKGVSSHFQPVIEQGQASEPKADFSVYKPGRGRPRASQEQKRANATARQARWRDKKALEVELAA